MTGIGFELDDHSDEVKAALDSAVNKGLLMIGLQAENYAAMKAPVDTGRLRASITHALEESEQAVYIGTNVEYAPYVELGTSKTKAQPFLRPAAADHQAEYKAMMEAVLRNG